MGETCAVNATEFMAKCLDLLDQVNSGAIARLEAAKRGKVVAVVTKPPATEAGDLHGFMRRSVIVPPGLDLTAPTGGRCAHGCGAGQPASVSAVLLDTGAGLWLAQGEAMSEAGRAAIPFVARALARRRLAGGLSGIRGTRKFRASSAGPPPRYSAAAARARRQRSSRPITPVLARIVSSSTAMSARLSGLV